MLTGLTSDSLNAMSDADAKKAIKTALETTPVALLSRSVMACDNYINDTTTIDQFIDTMGSVLKDAANTEHTISTVYSDLGNKYSLVETTKTRLDTLSDNLTEEYKDILGADPYEAITEMFSYQYSYSAALKMGSNLMQSSLFDFSKCQSGFKGPAGSKTASGYFPIPPKSTSGSKLRDQFSGKHDLYPGYQTSF